MFIKKSEESRYTWQEAALLIELYSEYVSKFTLYHTQAKPNTPF